MKVLYYNRNNKRYTWGKVTGVVRNCGWLLSLENGTNVPQSAVISSKADFRKNSIICVGCGKLLKVKPGETEIDVLHKHFEEEEAGANCAKCLFAKIHADLIKKVIKITADGRAKSVTTEEGTLYCSNSYRTRSIDEAKANHSCVFYKCRSTDSYYDFPAYRQYPDIFKTGLPTLKALQNGKKFKFNRLDKYTGYAIYVYYGIEAWVNHVGIVEFFKTTKRSREYNFIYSPTYNKFFRVFRTDWREFDGYEFMDSFKSGTEDKVVAEIKRIYG